MTKRRNPPKKLHFCKICFKTISGSPYKFRSHLFKHNVVKARYKCKFCLKEFFRLDTYSVHVQRHEGKFKLTQKSYICDYCDRSFASRTNLISHLKRIHDDRIDAAVGKFSCTVCKLDYCERRILEQHIRKVHFNSNLSKEPCHLNKSVNDSWIERVASKNACVRITKVNNNVITIKRLKDADVKTDDILTKSVEQESQCIDQYSMAVCDYCKKEMIKKSLRLHIQEIHMNVRKFTCRDCKKAFKRHYQFVKHSCGTRKYGRKVK